MSIYRFAIGIWEVGTQIVEIGGMSRMAVVSACAGAGSAAIHTEHVVVYEHRQGADEEAEAEQVVRDILEKAH